MPRKFYTTNAQKLTIVRAAVSKMHDKNVTENEQSKIYEKTERAAATPGVQLEFNFDKGRGE